MDKKQLAIGVVLAVVLLAAWSLFRAYIDHLHPDWAQVASHPIAPLPSPSAPQTQASTQPEASTEPAELPGATTLPSATRPVSTLHIVEVGQKARAAVLGSSSPKDGFVIKLKLSPYGASINEAELNEFRSSDHPDKPYAYQGEYPGHAGTASLATRSITIDGTVLDLSEVPWALGENSRSSATYTLDIERKGRLIATLEKKFILIAAGGGPTTSQGYEIEIESSIRNRSGEPLEVQSALNGPTMPPREVERGADRMVLSGYKSGPSYIAMTQHTIEEFKAGKATFDLTKNSDGQPLLWAGTCSVYFDSILMPLAAEWSGPTTRAAGSESQKVSYSLKADALDPAADIEKAVVLTFASNEMKLAAGQAVTLPSRLFLGPKKRDLLNSAYYAAYPRDYAETLVVRSSMCGMSFCTFGWLVTALVWLLWAFHYVAFHDWGLAIILLVILVRVLLHPITKRSQVHMVKMGTMGPEMERLKLKYGDDKDALNKAMMQFYKEQGMTPILGCLPMFLQMPIWIALWGALQSTFELRLAPFLWFGHVHLTWISDLARPDAIMTWAPVNVPMLGPVGSLNVLPILMAAVFYLQQKFQPKAPATTPQQQQQQKLMPFMSLLFPLFLYTGPAGLNLYILTSTTMGIFENKIIRDHIKRREEAEKAGRVFVEAKPTRGARQAALAAAADKKKGEAPSGCITGWLSQMQQKVEDVRREPGRKDRK